jgi:hypothetical protein
MIQGLPPGLTAYRRTPVFTETTLPAALRQRHRTKAGVWVPSTSSKAGCASAISTRRAKRSPTQRRRA